MLPDSTLPVVQVLEKRHVPPLPHVLVQHIALAGSMGQEPLCAVPPAEEQVPVVKHTPGMPPAVQTSFIAACMTVEIAASMRNWRNILSRVFFFSYNKIQKRPLYIFFTPGLVTLDLLHRLLWSK